MQLLRATLHLLRLIALRLSFDLATLEGGRKNPATFLLRLQALFAFLRSDEAEKQGRLLMIISFLHQNNR